MLPTLSETRVQRIHDCTEVAPLFFGTPDHSGQRGSSIQHPQQPCGDRTCIPMGNRTFLLGYHI
jgi:hypothetical protein